MARFTLVIAIATTLSGCGTLVLPRATPQPATTPQLASGWQVMSVTGAESDAIDPALIERKAGGYVLAYATDRLGDKHVFVTTSPDGVRWSTPVAVAKSELTDESPALWEDAHSRIHLLFASNRTNQYGLYEATSSDAVAWGNAVTLPADTQEAYHPSAALLASGSAAIAYETLGGTLRFRTRAADATWGDPSTVYQGGADPSLVAQPDGSLVVAFKSYQRLYLRSRSTMGVWSQSAEVPVESEAETPCLALDGHGGLWMVYAQQDGMNWKVSERHSDGHAWGSPADVALGGLDNEHPAGLINRAGERVLAWSAAGSLRGAGIFFARHR